MNRIYIQINFYAKNINVDVWQNKTYLYGESVLIKGTHLYKTYLCARWILLQYDLSVVCVKNKYINFESSFTAIIIYWFLYYLYLHLNISQLQPDNLRT